ncbi:MAG: DUF1080 domain-containing protein [Parabacteroides sp.]|nr:DUF1080 domain-containing protein [Parabacteroides sp.]
METNKLRMYLFLGGGLLTLIAGKLSAQEANIYVDASKIENKISPYLYGACIEDVNHEIYGGLYDQKIFGESFEEPARGFAFDQFAAYEGFWEPRDEGVAIGAFPGAKLVYKPMNIDKGIVEVELRMNGNAAHNAGLLVRVNNPGNGADSFEGYEVSLAADGKKVIFGRHRMNWQSLKEVAVDCAPQMWNKLKVRMDGAQIEVFLNGKSLFIYDDKESPILEGQIALRTWNADSEFRSLTIKKEGRKEKISYIGKKGLSVSSHWDAIQTADAKAVFAHDESDAYNGKYSQIIQMDGNKGMVGIANQSLNRWGISVTKGQLFQGRLYLKGEDFKGTVTVALQNADGTREYASQTIKSVSGNWEKYPFSLLTNDTDPKSRLAIYINQPGKIHIDQVVLMTTGDKQFHELPFRNDIGQMMQEQGLTFLRYGGTMVNAPEYRFKKMIGDPDKRPPYRGHWNLYSTNGFEIEDFLAFCEAAGFTAAFAVNIEETPEDIADMVEYLNGPVSSVWGKKRADNGHPKPYNVKYIEIGNEEVIHADDAEGCRHYIDRFNLLYDAIKSKDKSVEVINSAWWRPDSPNMEMVFKALNGKSFYWDYHPWADELSTGENVEKELKQMQQLFLKWDPNTRMKCAIFEENGNLHNMQRALGHVTLQNAVRRNGDFVFTSCAANALQPYLQNDNGWDQGQIFFTPTQVWGMPPFYAQQIASKNHLPLLVNSKTTGNLDVTATRDEEGKLLVLHVANTTNKSVQTNVKVNGIKNMKNVEIQTLSGDLKDRNTPEDPCKIIPVTNSLSATGTMKFDFPAYSYTILKYSE